MGTGEIKLNLNLELVVTPEGKTNLDKFVTNDWPARLLLDVMGVINEKVESYYSKLGDYETCSVIDNWTNEYKFSGSRAECVKYINDRSESSTCLSIIP